MSTLAVGLALAVVASLALNASYVIQHAGASKVPKLTLRRPLATLRGLFGSPLWLAGGALGMAGWLMHISALSRAPLSLVQAFLAGGLAIAAPIASWMLGVRPSRGEWRAIALMAVALVLLTTTLGHVGIHGRFNAPKLAVFQLLSIALAAVVISAPGARMRRAASLGLCGGVLYGAADVALKALTHVFARHGAVGLLRSPWLLVAIVTSVCAFFAFQRGLQSGRSLPVIGLMTAGTNLVSILGGLAVFGDPLGRTPLDVVLHLGGFALVFAAAWMLAPAQARVTHAEEEQPAEPEKLATEKSTV